jgi:hypothetical protein
VAKVIEAREKFPKPCSRRNVSDALWFKRYPDRMSSVLVYKRPHTGDPDAVRRFGVNDCMGSSRCRRFEAVIGIGGIYTMRSRGRGGVSSGGACATAPR